MKKTTNILLIIIIIFTTASLNSNTYDRILAIVNDDVITLYDLQDNVNKVRESLIKMGQPTPENLVSIFFDRMINQKIVNQIAEKKSIFVEKSDLDAAIENIKKMNRWSDKTFREELKRAGKTIDDLREEYKNQILSEKIIGLEIRSTVQEPTEDEMLEFYNKNKKNMVAPPRVRIKHILIMDNPNISLSQRGKLKKNAESILNKALSGENFEKLARKYSEDTASAPLGGDIGYITKGEWLPEIDEYVFRLQKEEIAPKLLYSRWGWHIVKVVEKKKEHKLSFEEVKYNIKNELIAQKTQEKYQEWIERQKDNSYIEVILDNDQKYIYYNGRWKKKGAKEFLSTEEIYKKIKELIL